MHKAKWQSSSRIMAESTATSRGWASGQKDRGLFGRRALFLLVGTLRRRAAELMGRREQLVVLAKIVGMSKINQVHAVKRELR